MTTLLNKTVRLFLESIGRREEYEFYLNKFRRDEHPCFAVLCPERADFEDVSSLFSFDVQFLLQLELEPLILLCGPETETMENLLFADEHAFEKYPVRSLDADLDGLTPFILECRNTEKAVVVTAPGLALDDLLLALIPDTAPRVHFIRSRGPLRGMNEERIFCYYTARPNDVDIGDIDRPLMERAAALLDDRPGTHISVASPWNLLKELFTVKGAGCMVRRGSIIRRVTDRKDIDEDRMVALLEESFKRSLVDRSCLDGVQEIYLEENYRGAALLEAHEPGMYLSKFAVGTQARGESLAYELWQDLTRDHENLFWRAGLNNPICQWYEKQADGYHREGEWIVFWRGIASVDLSEIIQYSLNRPTDFA